MNEINKMYRNDTPDNVQKDAEKILVEINKLITETEKYAKSIRQCLLESPCPKSAHYVYYDLLEEIEGNLYDFRKYKKKYEHLVEYGEFSKYYVRQNENA